jgi:hypothetical protein
MGGGEAVMTPVTSAAEQLRQAADHLEANTGNIHEGAPESRRQFADLLRTIAAINEADPSWSERHPVALGIAQRVNKMETVA